MKRTSADLFLHVLAFLPPPSLHVRPFSPFLLSPLNLAFLSRSLFRFCFPLPGLAPSLPARWSAPLAGAQAQSRPRGSRVTRRRAASSEGGAARPGLRSTYGRSQVRGPPLLYLRLRAAAAGPVGTEETRWRCALCGGS